MSKKALEILTEPMLYVLMSLLRRERCGTEIAAFATDKTGGRLTIGPGTLYTILARFEEEGLIRETRVEGRRRTYEITDHGRGLYSEEIARLRICLADAESEGAYETVQMQDHAGQSVRRDGCGELAERAGQDGSASARLPACPQLLPV